MVKRKAGKKRRPSRPRVVLVGEQTLVLEALRHGLASELDVEGCVSDIVMLDEALALAPDAAVFHFPAARAEGLDQLRRLRRAVPDAAVVVLAEDEDPRLAAEAFGLGVHGWVLKSSTVSELVAGVRSALSGRRYLTALVAGGRVEALPRTVRTPGHGSGIRPREREVLQLLGEGKVMREIGVELGITTRTVAFHKYRMMENLGVQTTAELLQLAFRDRMLSPGSRLNSREPVVSVQGAAQGRFTSDAARKEGRR